MKSKREEAKGTQTFNVQSLEDHFRSDSAVVMSNLFAFGSHLISHLCAQPASSPCPALGSPLRMLFFFTVVPVLRAMWPLQPIIPHTFLMQAQQCVRPWAGSQEDEIRGVWFLQSAQTHGVVKPPVLTSASFQPEEFMQWELREDIYLCFNAGVGRLRDFISPGWRESFNLPFKSKWFFLPSSAFPALGTSYGCYLTPWSEII